MKTTKIKTYKIFSSAKVLRDTPEGIRPPVQISYLNEVMGLFLRTLIKVYSPEELPEKDRANLKRYFNKILEAKDAIDCKFPTSHR